MNTFVGVVALTVAALIHFEALQMREEEMLIKISLILFAGIFFVRAEVEELRNYISGDGGEDKSPPQPPTATPRLRS